MLKQKTKNKGIEYLKKIHLLEKKLLKINIIQAILEQFHLNHEHGVILQFNKFNKILFFFFLCHPCEEEEGEEEKAYLR